jgi:quercetin dioxygenase-like cupin family protein
MSDPINELDYSYIADLVTMLPDIPADTIVSRTFYGDDGVKGIVFGFAAGQELSEHTAARPAILHFLSGEAQLTLGEETFAAGPGTWIHMKAQLAHSVLAQTPVVMLLLLLP